MHFLKSAFYFLWTLIMDNDVEFDCVMHLCSTLDKHRNLYWSLCNYILVISLHTKSNNNMIIYNARDVGSGRSFVSSFRGCYGNSAIRIGASELQDIKLNIEMNSECITQREQNYISRKVLKDTITAHGIIDLFISKRAARSTLLLKWVTRKLERILKAEHSLVTSQKHKRFNQHKIYSCSMLL